MPEPRQEYLQQLSQFVKDKRLDVGLATDGDADRFAVIDEMGNYFRPNQLLCLLARHLVKTAVAKVRLFAPWRPPMSWTNSLNSMDSQSKRLQSASSTSANACVRAMS